MGIRMPFHNVDDMTRISTHFGFQFSLVETKLDPYLHKLAFLAFEKQQEHKVNVPIAV